MSSNKGDTTTGDTGTRDITYNLISTAYHLLQGAETVSKYIEDAEQEGNQELAQFFRETKEEYQRRASRAEQLLASHIGKGKGQGASGS